jgi:predicted ATPase
MLETLHEYALEQLEKRGETDELRRKHHKWFSALLDKEIDDRDVQTFSLTNPPSLDLEHENINAALAWALEQRLRRGRGHPHRLQ